MGSVKAAIICFAGRVASGKSALSIELAKKLDWPRVSFGDYVRAVCLRIGRSPSREELQRIGEELIMKSVSEFCKSVLEQADWATGEPVVIDGIRHREVLDELRTIAKPLDVHLVYVDIDEKTQRLRLMKRDNLSDEAIKRIEGHPTEVQLGSTLRDAADLVVDGTQPLNEIVTNLAAWLASKTVVET